MFEAYTCYEKNMVTDLKDLIWKLERGDTIEYDFDLVKAIETAIETVDEYSELELDIDDIVEYTAYWDTDDLNKLIKELRTIYKKYSKDKQVTVDDAMEQVMAWYELKLDDLKQEARDYYLSDIGTKKEIIERLKEDYLKENKIVV